MKDCSTSWPVPRISAAVLERTQWRTWHPPLSFLVNHFFLLAGNSDFFLRLPSALCGIGSLPLCYVLIKRLASARTAVFVVLVLALSPFHIWYSQEGRMYAQLLFLFLLSSIILLHALEHRQWQLVGLIRIGGCGRHAHTRPDGLWGAGPRIMVAPVSPAPAALLDGQWSGGCAAVSTLGFVVPLGKSFSEYDSQSAKDTLGSVSSGFSWEVLPYTFFVYSTGFSLGPSVAELHENRSLGFILQFLPLLLTVGIIVGTLLVIGIWALYKQYGARCVVFCLLGLVLPLGGAVLFSLMPRGLFNVRYTILAFPYFCTFVGSALAVVLQEKPGSLGWWPGLPCWGLVWPHWPTTFTNPRYAKEDIKAAVAAWRSLAPHEYLLSAVPGGTV